MSAVLGVCLTIIAILVIIYLISHTALVIALTVIAVKMYKFGKKQGPVFDLAEKLSMFLPKGK